MLFRCNIFALVGSVLSSANARCVRSHLALRRVCEAMASGHRSLALAVLLLMIKLLKEILFLRAGARDNTRFQPNKVIIWDDQRRKDIGELSFRHEVRTPRSRQQGLASATTSACIMAASDTKGAGAEVIISSQCACQRTRAAFTRSRVDALACHRLLIPRLHTYFLRRRLGV